MSQPALTRLTPDEVAELVPVLLERNARFEQTLIAHGIPFCRGCGCTAAAACDPPCFWIEPDLCSSCRGGG